MSLQTALQVVGLIAIAYLLFWGVLAMGPIGWLVVVPLLVVGVIQAHRSRNRTQQSGDGPSGLNYCPNCGSGLEVEFNVDEAGTESGSGETTENGATEADWDVRYCPECGASLEAVTSGRDGTTGTDRSDSVTNCLDCGAPNDPGRSTCKHCNVPLDEASDISSVP